ncbi:TetR/AcrR family transcriptional regulator [Bacteriovorax sp. DB6_IX]|uniref:TetR/AcrR family transcriptional regulator n=1 Tax=Bacteriovorax sp. DB6_IX TaxID=1353530 RepID=UPI000389E85E|nr:TetR/AcrR family transcriptional regulator [Bacteriovorax sp. DB6_IX]EQC52141.1 transcriptional regulator, TetR family [Bacteriovorax sp. DB6_IX]
MRELILEKAEQQMRSGGFENLNFGQIAKELGTTRANLHYHFKNKESLAIEVTKKYGEHQFELLAQLIKQFKGDFFGAMKASEELFWQQAYQCDSTRICVCTQMVKEPDLPENLQDMSCTFYRMFENLHVELLQDAIDNGQIRADIDIQREATRLHITIMGIMTCGQHIGDIKQAHKELSGFLMDWANSLK